MRRARDLPAWLRDTVLRMLPHATRPGLYPIGRPGPDAPVVCTGNFTLTVRRMKDALAGHDAWLLVADSHGINVWCAAGGGHLTHHSVIAALRAFEVARHVEHRRLVLPQLAATGIERRLVEEATGWKPVWGPARLEDLPGFLARGLKLRRAERTMRFPAWERLERARNAYRLEPLDAPTILIRSADFDGMGVPLARWRRGASARRAADSAGPTSDTCTWRMSSSDHVWSRRTTSPGWPAKCRWVSRDGSRASAEALGGGGPFQLPGRSPGQSVRHKDSVWPFQCQVIAAALSRSLRGFAAAELDRSGTILAMQRMQE